MNLSIGSRLGFGFLCLIVLLIVCSGAGLTGVNAVSSSLLFISGPAKEAADGGMQTTINLKGEILATERILSGDIAPDTGKSLINSYRSASAKWLNSIHESGLIEPVLINKTQALINQYREAQQTLINSFLKIKEHREELAKTTDQTLAAISTAELDILELAEQTTENPGLIEELHSSETLLSELRSSILIRNHNLNKLFETADPISQKQIEDQLQDNFQLVDNYSRILSDLEYFGLHKQMQSLQSNLNQTLKTFSKVVNGAIKFRKDRTTLSQNVDLLISALAQVEKRAQTAATDELKQIGSLVDTSKSLIWIASTGGIIAALTTFFIVLVTVIKPVRNIAENLALIGAGEGNLNASLPETGAKELVILSQGFNKFVSKIKNTVTGVSEAADKIGHSTTSLISISSETANAIAQQTEQTEQAATAINEMTATANDVANNAASAANAASKADNASVSGKHQVDSTITAIGNQIDQLEGATSVIAQLDHDSRRIGSVLNVINDIADQTNLLALNATIEAARAGEAGRGFSVVADEVRQLASRTQSATDEIQDVVKNLQSATSEAVSSMTECKTFADECSSKAELAGDSLNQIIKASNTISEMNLHIAEASKQQAQVSESINLNVVRINEQAKDTQDASSRIIQSTQELTDLGNRLQNLIEEFKY